MSQIDDPRWGEEERFGAVILVSTFAIGLFTGVFGCWVLSWLMGR